MHERVTGLSANARGALWILLSVLGATVMTIGVREAAQDLHSIMLAFLRSVLAAFAVLPLFWRSPDIMHLRTYTAWKIHLARGVAMCVALNGGFYSIWQLPLATATVLFFLAPVFATLLAGPVLGERVGPRRWGAVLAGFVGAVIILRPGMGTIDWAMLAGVFSAMAFALALLLGRLASNADGPDSVFVSSSLITPFGTLPPALFFWDLPATLAVWVLVGVVVAASALRTYADVRAYAIGDAGFLAPFSYLRLLTIGIAGYVLFGEVIDWPTALGGSVIIASTLFIAFRESQLKKVTKGDRSP